jgi:hypothetical protein
MDGQPDPLVAFTGLATCPVCGCLDRKGTYRCPECGTFHAGSIMEEREAPAPTALVEVEPSPIDPSVYSVGPHASIPEEIFDESDDVKSWDGGSSDFTFDDTDDLPVHVEQKLPPVEELEDED